MERTYYSGPRLAGMILILAGALFLFSSVLGAAFWITGRILWPLALLLLGAAFLERQVAQYRQTGRIPFPWPLFLLFGGISGLLKTFGIFTFGWFSWPVLLIAIGLWMLFGRR